MCLFFVTVCLSDCVSFCLPFNFCVYVCKTVCLSKRVCFCSHLSVCLYFSVSVPVRVRLCLSVALRAMNQYKGCQFFVKGIVVVSHRR